MTFTTPAISAAHLKPTNGRVLARVESVPDPSSLLSWKPADRQRAGLALGFVVYGRVISTPDVVREARWTPDGGRVVSRPCAVRMGQRIVWKHGYGPSIELVDGTHFLVAEEGIAGVLDVGHEHVWQFIRQWNAYHCADRNCLTSRRDLETRLPSCGREVEGPRVGRTAPVFDDSDFVAPVATLRPYGRRVLACVETPPLRETVIWTPSMTRVPEGPTLGHVLYARVVRAGEGANEPAQVWDAQRKRWVPDGSQLGAPRERYSVRGRQGPEVRERPVVSRAVWTPTRSKPGDRVVLAQGWGVENDDGTHLAHEAAVLASWTPRHSHCVHAASSGALFRCCECLEPVAWDDDPDAPVVLGAVIGTDPTNLAPFEGMPEPDPDEMSEALLRFRGEDS